MLNANFIALFYRTGVTADGNKDFRLLFALVTLTLIHDLHIRIWPVFIGVIPDVQIWTFYVNAFESYRLTDRQTRVTRPKLYTVPLRGWSTIITFIYFSRVSHAKLQMRWCSNTTMLWRLSCQNHRRWRTWSLWTGSVVKTTVAFRLTYTVYIAQTCSYE